MSRDSRQCLASAVSVLIRSDEFGRMWKNSTSPSNIFRCTHSLTLWDAKDASPPVRVLRHLGIVTFTIYLYTVTEMRECRVCYCRIIRLKNVKGNRVTVSPGHCQSRISGDVSWVSRDRATRSISESKTIPLLLRSMFIARWRLWRIENRRKKTSFLPRIIYALARPSMSAFRVTAPM